jgi:hypothetical protein
MEDFSESSLPFQRRKAILVESNLVLARLPSKLKYNLQPRICLDPLRNFDLTAYLWR